MNQLESAGGMRPVRLGPSFHLTPVGLRIAGDPTLEEWQGVGQGLWHLHQSVPFAIADLLNYAETRADWQDKLDQAIAVTGLARHTITKLAYVGRRVEAPERLLAPSLSHAEEVAALDSATQRKWLQEAVDNGWTRNELRQEIRKAKRRTVIDVPVEGEYRTWLVDVDWDDSAKLARLPVGAKACPDALMFLWVSAGRIWSERPKDVITAWGFEYAATVVWNRVYPVETFNAHTQVCHEFLMVCTRGQGIDPSERYDSVYTAREWPDRGAAFIQQRYPGPYAHIGGQPLGPSWVSLFTEDK